VPDRYGEILVVDLLGGIGDLLMVLPVVHGLARRCRETKPRRRVVALPAVPAMAHVKPHPGCAQPMQPGTQQRRGLQVDREDTLRAADEGLDAQAARPGAQRVRPERAQHRRECIAARAVALEQRIEGLAVGQVQPALAREQELAAD